MKEVEILGWKDKKDEWQHQIRSFVSRFRKRPKGQDRIPKAKKSTKPLRLILWAVLILMVLSAPLTFLRSGNALNYSMDNKQALEEVQAAMTSDESDKEVSEEKVELFGDRFVEDYFTISENTSERTSHQERLQQMVATDVELPNVDGFSGSRAVNNTELYDSRIDGNTAILEYRVTYTTTVPKENEDDNDNEDNSDDDSDGSDDESEDGEETEKEKTQQDVLLSVPIQANNGKYVVYEQPTMDNVPSMTGSGEKPKNNLEDESEVEQSKKQHVKQWLDDFFSNYASESNSDMSYMMEHPEGLNGVQTYGGQKETHVYPGDDEGQYIVKTTVLFEEPNTSIQQPVDFTLHLEEDSDQNYYVTKMMKTLSESS